MLTYITHLVDCSWFENKSILTYITHRVFMLQMLQSMLTYLAHNKICGYRFLIVIYLSPNIYTVICVPKLLQIYNLKSHFKHTCWHTWCRISKWACVPKLEQKSLYSRPIQLATHLSTFCSRPPRQVDALESQMLTTFTFTSTSFSI